MAKKRTKRQGAPGKGSAPPTGGTKDEADLEKDDAGASESESDERASAPDGESPESPTEGEAEAKSESDGAESDAAESDAAESKAEESKADAGAAEEEPAGEKLAARTAEDGDAPAKDRKAPPKGAAWGEPFARFEAAWTKLETRLITWVLVAQLISMVSWVLLNGLSSPVQSGNLSGLVIRQVLGALGLGLGAYFATRKLPSTQRSLATIAGIVLGVAIAKSWRSTGVDYFDNVKAWLQEGSTLTLMGGLRGVATRLTLWLALLGGSIATASGKHINIDVIFRFVPARLRKPIALVNYCAAALVCLSAVWGFFDHIAIESYGAGADDKASAKVHIATERMGDHFFLLRKQLRLDLKTFPHIVKGERFDRWMGAAEWNQFVKDAEFDGRYEKELVETILVPADAPPHTPLVLAPDGESTRGILVHDLGLVFPVGMLMIALRFLLRVILALSGHIEVDPDAAHKEEIGSHHTAAAEPEKGGA